MAKAKDKRTSSVRLADSPTERLKVFNALCKHLEQGYSMDCFDELSEGTIKKYFDVYPEEFDSERLSEALRNGKRFWESVGRKQACGECLGNSRSWYYNMANRYGWRERLDATVEAKGTLQVSVVSYASIAQPTVPDKICGGVVGSISFVEPPASADS
jgi:hypothetical protein